MATSFKTLAKGDHAFKIVRDGKRRYAIREEVTAVTTKFVSTLPCYADGTPMLYFPTLWRRASGVEASPPDHRPRQRLVRELPAGVQCVAPLPALIDAVAA